MPRLKHFPELRGPDTSLERLRELAGLHPEYARAIAGQVHTPQALLLELAHRPERGIRRALAGNPSTPEVLLFKLACAFPAEFLGNPLLELLALEDPVFWQKLPSATRRALARCPDTPLRVLEQVSQPFDAPVRLALFANPSAPLHLLKRFRPYYQNGDSEDRFRALAHGERAEQTHILHALETPLSFAGVSDPLARVLLALGTELHLRPREQEALEARLTLTAASSTKPLLPPELRDPRTPHSRLLELWRHPELRPALARHPGMDPGFVLDRLAQASDPAVRWLSLRAAALPRRTLARFLRSSLWKERLAVSVHPSASYRMLRVLALDPHLLVQGKALERLRLEHGEQRPPGTVAADPPLEPTVTGISGFLRRLFGKR